MTDKIKLLNEDCMAVMARYPDKYFDLAIVDPPYGIQININMGRRKGDKSSEYHKFHGGDKEVPKADYFTELFRVSKNQIIWGGNYMTQHLPPSPCWLLWDKLFSEDVTFAQYEMAWTSFKTSSKKYDKHPSQQYRIHPTQKPVDLYKWILSRYAEPGQRILDTHLGSASSAIAAHYFGVSEFVGTELDPAYFAAAQKRFHEQTKQLTLI